MRELTLAVAVSAAVAAFLGLAVLAIGLITRLPEVLQ